MDPATKFIANLVTKDDMHRMVDAVVTDNGFAVMFTVGNEEGGYYVASYTTPQNITQIERAGVWGLIRARIDAEFKLTL